MAEKLWEKIQFHVSMIKPNKLLYLCFDGVPSKAKLATQRSRRWDTYVDDRVKHDELLVKARADGTEGNGTEAIYRCEISPGTEFMAYISNFIAKAISTMTDSGAWTGFRVTFSDVNECGEGEQKIITHINNFKMRGLIGSYAIYSKDADTCILSALTHKKNLFVYWDAVDEVARKGVEEDNASKGVKGDNVKDRANPMGPKKKFQMVKMSRLRDIIINIMTGGANDCDPYETERIIDDFVFLTILLGNDCVLRFPSTLLTFDDIFECYVCYRTYFRRRYLTRFDGIDVNNILIFLGLVASVETGKILSDWIKRYEKMEAYMPQHEIGVSRPSIFERTEKSRESHYLHHFVIDSLESVPLLVGNHIRLLSSYWHLISRGRAICKGSYSNQRFSPFISDMVASREYISFWDGGEPEELEPLQHLLLLLPLECKHLLPNSYQAFREQEVIRDIFGTQESLKLKKKGKQKNGHDEGNRRAYIDHGLILDALKNSDPHPNKLLTEKEMRRNRRSYPLMFPNGHGDDEVEGLSRQTDEEGDAEFSISSYRYSLPDESEESWEQRHHGPGA